MPNPYAPPGDRPRAEGAGAPPTGSGDRPGDAPPQPGDGPPGPATPGPGRHEGPRRPPASADPERAREAGTLFGRYALLLLASLVVSGLPLPWRAAALAFSLAALVVGVQALRAVVRAGMRRASAVMLGVVIGMTAFLVLGQVALLALWPLQQDLQDCQDRALTLAATEACQRDFTERMEELTRFPAGSS